MKLPSLLCVGLALLVSACAVPSARTNTHGEKLPTVTAKLPPEPTHLGRPSVLEEDEETAKTNTSTSKTKRQDRTVRVLIVENSKSTYIKHSGRVNIYTQDLSKKYKISRSGSLSVKTYKNSQVQVGTLTSGQPVIIVPVDGTTLEIDKIVYTGTLYVLPSKTSFSIIEYTPLESYLYGVLPYEMHPTWALEALKAQAVAARTYTLKSIEKKADEPFDLYADVRSQMYKGSATVQDAIKKAVDQTRGQVLAYKGELFYTYYHGNCGGGTDHVSIWNQQAPHIKPLAGNTCKFDTHSKSYTFKQDIAKSTVERFTKNQGLKGNLKSIKIAKKTGTGRASYLTLKTSGGSKTVLCSSFRAATGVRSCKLTKITTGNSKVHFEGHGYGHGIGMCQDGAHGMAKQNYTYKQILKHYYPGSTLSQFR
ncbi:MAG: SpoIID/LytB domain-containing protein [Elusimicrobiaceae bacterium]|nr:SpoIID/LytB domain-containing protein [Elusimicrobiaceae bacterium]